MARPILRLQPSPLSTPRRLRAAERGLTRFELMLACAVLGIGGVGVAAWQLYQAEAGGDEVARTRGQQVLTAAADWKREHLERGCPSITQLQQDSLLQTSARAEDPWGHRFRIRCSNGEVSVLSAGKDGRFETGDDITLVAEPNS